jgi:uncharacterized membrane protein YgcG
MPFHHVRALRPAGRLLWAVAVAVLAVAASATGTVGTVGPAQAQVQTAPAPAPEKHHDVRIEDPDGLLDDAARQDLAAQTGPLVPDSVRQVDYIFLGDGAEDGWDDDDNFNDEALDWVGDHRPDLVPGGTGKGATWRDGSLILVIGVATHGNGVYCGDDVCDALDLRKGGHLDQTLADMKPGLKDGDYVRGMIDGLRTAGDPSKVVDNSGEGWFIAGITVVVLAPSAGILVWQRRRKRRAVTATAREQFTDLTDHYSDIALRLDQIDVRAHSLTSRIADAELRRQWEDCRDAFLEVDKIVGDTGLSVQSTDKEFRARAGTVADADEAVDHMRNAEENIDRIFAMEQGDADVRRSETDELIDDIVDARRGTENPAVSRQLKALAQRCATLRDAPDTPDFMARFATVIAEYSRVMELVEREMEKLRLDVEGRVPPRIWDADYRVGSGYRGWTPYRTVSGWHAADVQRFASSSSTNTSFSSGFSGGGGSSRW